ncbi:AAA family ATPase [Amycolatopsis lurida]|uniref:AAA family ATPase n=1 Tax=Amycolatopsis lurida TaxID=31959 RepID=UPI00366553BE
MADEFEIPRRAIIDRVTAWLAGPERMLLVVGEPGAGKTVVARQVAAACSSQVVLAHYCRVTNERSLNPKDFLSALSSKLADTVPGFAEAREQALPAPRTHVTATVNQQIGTVHEGGQALGLQLHVDNVTLPEFYAAAVRRPLAACAGPGRPMLVIVDDLSASLAHGSVDQTIVALLRMIATSGDELPTWLRFLVTSRPDEVAVRDLSQVPFELTAERAHDGLDEYVRARLSADGSHLRERIVAAAQANFLFARHMVDDVLAGRAEWADGGEAVPQSLSEIYQRWLTAEREKAGAGWRQRFVPVLRALAVAQGDGFEIAQLAGITAQHRADVRDVLESMSQFLHTEGERRSIYHDSFRDFLAVEEIDPSYAHRAVIDYFVGLHRGSWEGASDYALRHLATHATHCDVLDEVIADTDYLVYAAPDELLAAMRSTVSAAGQLTRSIYRASVGLHRHLSPGRRRQVLATDAARFGATRQHRALAAPLAWQPRWATGRQTSSALHLTLTGHPGEVRAVACTTVNGKPVAVTGSDEETVRVWDLTDGTLLTTLTGHPGGVRAVACTTINGQPVAVTGGEEETARVWDLSDGTLLTTLPGHRNCVWAVACMTINGRPVAVTNDKETARVWDLVDGALLTTRPGHGAWVWAMACATVDGEPVVVTASAGTLLTVEDLVSGAERAFLDSSPQRSVACTAIDGRPVSISTSESGFVEVLDLATGTHWDISIDQHVFAYAVACTTIDNRPMAVIGDYDGVVRMYALTTGTVRAIFPGHRGTVEAVACTTIDEQPIAVTGSSDGTLRVWSLGAASKHDFVGAGDITAVGCTTLKGEPAVVTFDEAGNATAWELATGVVAATVPGGLKSVTAAACTTVHGQPVAVTNGSADTVRVWNLATNEVKTTRASDHVYALACTTIDGQPVAVTGDSGGRVRVRDVATWTVRTDLVGHQDAVCAVACATFDGRPVAMTASHSGRLHGIIHPPSYYAPGKGTVLVWDLATGARIATLSHPNEVRAVTGVTVDGRFVVVTAGWDETASVWDIGTGKVLSTLTGHRKRVRAVACTVLDGQPVAITTSDDNTVRIWDLTTFSEVALLDCLGQTVCVGPTQEIIIGAGWDLVVMDRRPN